MVGERPGTTKNAGSEASERPSVRSALLSGVALGMLLAARRFKRPNHDARRPEQGPSLPHVRTVSDLGSSATKGRGCFRGSDD